MWEETQLVPNWPGVSLHLWPAPHGPATGLVHLRCARCSENGTPVVFALSRKKMGQAYGAQKRVSAVAVLESNGVREVHAQALRLAQEGRERWEAA